MSELRFDCAICQRDIRDPWHFFRKGRDRLLPPLCRSCEGSSHQPVSRLGNSSFRDRRLACQIATLADALLGEANMVKWRQHRGAA
jgi:hypothetical protein